MHMTQQTESPVSITPWKTKRFPRSCLIFFVVFVFLCVVLAVIANTLPPNPLSSIIHTIGFIFTGRLHFPTQRIGETVIDEKGQEFTIFREVIVDPTKEQPEKPGAVLILHFKVTNMSPKQNQIYSALPLPLYIGNPGFRSKIFSINGQDCQSIYEWDTVKDAENYVNSIALKTILRRSVPGSVTYKIIGSNN
jgi:hypothetical protein